MSQILISKNRKSGLIQDFILNTNHPTIRSNALEIQCYVCGKGIHDGFNLTAKQSSGKSVFYCDMHF